MVDDCLRAFPKIKIKLTHCFNSEEGTAWTLQKEHIPVKMEPHNRIRYLSCLDPLKITYHLQVSALIKEYSEGDKHNAPIPIP